MKTVILKEFSELGRDLDEFPEFNNLAQCANIHNFADAFRVYARHELTREAIYKENVARFIIWLALAAKGDYKVAIGKCGPVSLYKSMQNWVGSNIEIYRQAKSYYSEAILTLKSLDPK